MDQLNIREQLDGFYGTFENFQNPALVQEALMIGAPKAGIYLLPGCPTKGKSLPPNQAKALIKEAHEKMEKGTFAFVAMRPHGTGPMGPLMVRSLLIQILGAFCLTGLLLLANVRGFIRRMGFVKLFALAAGIITYLPDWNWWGFSVAYTLVGMADLFIGWILAGLVIIKITSS